MSDLLKGGVRDWGTRFCASFFGVFYQERTTEEYDSS